MLLNTLLLLIFPIFPSQVVLYSVNALTGGVIYDILAFSFCSHTFFQKLARILAVDILMLSPQLPVGEFVGSDIQSRSVHVDRIHLT